MPTFMPDVCAHACGNASPGAPAGTSGVPCSVQLGNYLKPKDREWCLFLLCVPLGTIFFIFIYYILHFGPLSFTKGALLARPQYGTGYVSTLSPFHSGVPETAGVM